MVSSFGLWVNLLVQPKDPKEAPTLQGIAVWRYNLNRSGKRIKLPRSAVSFNSADQM
jgi:hypothetical protein